MRILYGGSVKADNAAISSPSRTSTASSSGARACRRPASSPSSRKCGRAKRRQGVRLQCSSSLMILHVLVCLVIVGLVLLQAGKGADIGSAFGGTGSQAVFGSMGTPTVLGKATTVVGDPLHGDVVRPGQPGAASAPARSCRPPRRPPAAAPAAPSAPTPATPPPRGPAGPEVGGRAMRRRADVLRADRATGRARRRRAAGSARAPRRLRRRGGGPGRRGRRRAAPAYGDTLVHSHIARHLRPDSQHHGRRRLARGGRPDLRRPRHARPRAELAGQLAESWEFSADCLS